MACHCNFSLDEATRRSWYNPDVVLRDTGLKRGMIFADIGCGDGFFTLLAAKVVGEEGIVYALDSDAEAIKRLNQKAEEQRLKNIKAKVGAAEETVFCTGCTDVVFCSMVLHDFKDPVQVLSNAKKMLNANGKFVNLDWKKQQNPFGPPFKIRISEQEAIGLLKISGYTVSKLEDAGPYHYVITAEPNEHC